MTRREIIKAIYSMTRDEIIIFSTGYACRDAYDLEDRDSNFYMVGSMGLAASIGIGIALNSKDKKVIVVEGDGSLLMSPNNMFIAGGKKVDNLIHIVIDNSMYETTGKQKTYSESIPFSRIAKELGYMKTQYITSMEEFCMQFSESVSMKKGPAFLHVQADPSNESIPNRVPIPLAKMKNRMVSCITNCRKELV